VVGLEHFFKTIEFSNSNAVGTATAAPNDVTQQRDIDGDEEYYQPHGAISLSAKNDDPGGGRCCCCRHIPVQNGATVPTAGAARCTNLVSGRGDRVVPSVVDAGGPVVNRGPMGVILTRGAAVAVARVEKRNHHATATYGGDEAVRH
jgi:hypothetical protein